MSDIMTARMVPPERGTIDGDESHVERMIDTVVLPKSAAHGDRHHRQMVNREPSRCESMLFLISISKLSS